MFENNSMVDVDPMVVSFWTTFNMLEEPKFFTSTSTI